MRVMPVRLFLVDACIRAASADKAEAILSSDVMQGRRSPGYDGPPGYDRNLTACLIRKSGFLFWYSAGKYRLKPQIRTLIRQLAII